jgi:hypothetical protein
VRQPHPNRRDELGRLGNGSKGPTEEGISEFPRLRGYPRLRQVPAEVRVSRSGISPTASAALIEVEVNCADEAEHRRRVETPTSDVEGLAKPTWRAVVEREYEPWTREHLVIDSHDDFS